MWKKIPFLGLGLLPGMVLFSAAVHAAPYSALEAHSFSMGGTGVASGTRAAAPFYNPALLAAGPMPEEISLHVPMAGARFYDKEKVDDALDSYQLTGLEAELDVAVNAYVAANTSDTRNTLGASANTLRQRLLFMDGKPMEREFFGAVVIGVPHDSIGIALMANAQVIGGAQVFASDNDLDGLQGMLDALTAGTLSSDPNQLFSSNDLTSTLNGRGLTFGELGLSLAREISVFGHGIAFGVTPKYRWVTSFDYAAELNTADFEIDLGEREHTAFDVDIGAAKHYNNGWRTGVAIKNLIGQEYTTVRGNVIRVEPQARLAASHSTQWTTVALDLDLNEAQGVGLSSDTQYIAVGAELDVFTMMQFRIGYRHNMANTETSIATFGMGFTLVGIQLDLAAGASDDEINYAAQMGFEF